MSDEIPIPPEAVEALMSAPTGDIVAAFRAALNAWPGMEEYHWDKCRDCGERGHHLILPLEPAP